MFNSLTLIGLGLMGGSLALDLKRIGHAKKIIGIDSHPEHCKTALELQLVDEIQDLQSSRIEETDLIIVATPVNASVQLIPALLDRISIETTLTDVGSTKEEICCLTRKHPKRSQFVAAHPMAGTENSGPSSALTGLFAQKTTVLCDTEESGELHFNRVQDLYTALGCRIVLMNSAEHDFHTAFVSHLSHLSSFALANTVLAEERFASNIFNLAGGGFESTVRLGKSSPLMWQAIFEQNRENILFALESFETHLADFRNSLLQKDWGRLFELMTRSNDIRKILDKSNVHSLKSTPIAPLKANLKANPATRNGEKIC